ncbi:polymeric immunoglobulin receptor-like isoform X2 [Silurus meridionalis]|uniref:polymeric immunoglobulin receptor-like isoform X2 n=1 Tax=Silurus meridionalis TaxID=175797 RepID=UPI001EECEA53|nr:polymeric immunoglobulin receptor-like isoform X2 [Silurus meridionalis]
MFGNRTQENLFFQYQNNSHMSYIFIFILFISNVVISQSASRKLSLQTGASVTIPCPYDRKYIHNKKYWCYDAASAYNFCKIQAYANETQGKVTLIDNPSESLFTVTMKDVVISQSAYRQLSLQTGASVTIPCSYDRKYLHHKKYWCYHAVSAYNYCTIQAYANKTQGKVTVTDNPAESLFTVTMKNLQTGNTGGYWCVVEIEGPAYDVTEYLYITVKAAPDLSVRESRVSGDEGGSVTVQCLYSAVYQNTQKKWCRFRDRRCNSVRRTDTSQNSAIIISDDGKSSFSVQMSGLKKSDGGWYWCSAGDLEVPVHISVRDPPPVVTTVVTTITHHVTTHTSVTNHTSASETTISSSNKTNEKVESLVHWYLVAFLLQILILVIIIFLLRKKCKNQSRIREGCNGTTVHTVSAASNVWPNAIQNQAESEETYNSIVKSRKMKPGERSLEQVQLHCKEHSSTLKDNDDVTYSSVKIASKNKTVTPNVVEAEIIYSSITYQD